MRLENDDVTLIVNDYLDISESVLNVAGVSIWASQDWTVQDAKRGSVLA